MDTAEAAGAWLAALCPANADAPELLPHLLLVSACASFGMQALNLSLSLSSVGDNFTGLVEFLPAALYGLWLQGRAARPRQVMATAMLAVWSLRLGGFLLYRMRHRPVVDTRLGRSDRRRLASLLFFWACHGTWGLVVSFPVTFLNGCGGGHPAELTRVDAACFAVWLLGLVVEALADKTKLDQHLRGCGGDYYCMGGHWLWRWTRNPNFFGETACWTGLAAMAALALRDPESFAWVAVLLSPFFTLTIMLGEAALLSEWKNNKRFGGDEAYLEYRRRTSLIFPCPPAVYKVLPVFVKELVFFDLPVYCKGLDKRD